MMSRGEFQYWLAMELDDPNSRLYQRLDDLECIYNRGYRRKRVEEWAERRRRAADAIKASEEPQPESRPERPIELDERRKEWAARRAILLDLRHQPDDATQPPDEPRGFV